MSTQPSAPKPVAKATSGPNSASAHLSTTSGGFVSNSAEIACRSSSAISCPRVDSAAAIYFSLPLSLHLGKNRAQLGAFCQLFFKPLETLTQPNDFTDDDDARRTHTGTSG